jgi:hypothetical protein
MKRKVILSCLTLKRMNNNNSKKLLRQDKVKLSKLKKEKED